jgi:MraZ protein
LATFLSKYVNKIDRKGRVSVPAAWRAALSTQGFQGVIAYPSFHTAALEGLPRETLDEMIRRQHDRTLADGDIAGVLFGDDDDDDLLGTILGRVRELPFDTEGRIVLPRDFLQHTGIDDEVAFVGRGTRFQLWAPGALNDHEASSIERARSRRTRRVAGSAP